MQGIGMGCSREESRSGGIGGIGSDRANRRTTSTHACTSLSVILGSIAAGAIVICGEGDDGQEPNRRSLAEKAGARKRRLLGLRERAEY